MSLTTRLYNPRSVLTTAGSDGDVQYKSGTELSAESAFNYNAANNELTVPGLTISEDLKLTGILSPPQITSDQNDYSPTGLSTASILRLDIDTSRQLTGLATGAKGRMIIIHNISSTGRLQINTEDTNSTAANRFSMDRNIRVMPKHTAVFWYDDTDSRWKISGRPLDYIQIDKTPADVSITNSSTETSIYSATIPAQMIRSNGMISVHIAGEYLNDSGSSRSLGFVVKLGSTTLHASSIASLGNSANKRVWVVNMNIYPNNNSSSNQYMTGVFQMSQDATPTTGIGEISTDEVAANSPFGGSSSESIASGLTLDVRFKHSTAHASLTITKKIAHVAYIP